MCLRFHVTCYDAPVAGQLDFDALPLLLRRMHEYEIAIEADAEDEAAMTSVLARFLHINCGKKITQPCSSSPRFAFVAAMHKSFQTKLGRTLKTPEMKSGDVLLSFESETGTVVLGLMAYQQLRPAFSVFLILTETEVEGVLLLATPSSGQAFAFRTSVEVLEGLEYPVEVRKHRFKHINLHTIETYAEDGLLLWTYRSQRARSVAVMFLGDTGNF
jgi:hypothetical protein